MKNIYPKPIIIMHWITFFLVATVYLTGGNPTATGLLGQIHLIGGISIFILFFIRLVFIFVYKKSISVIFIFCLSLNASNISVIKVEGMHCPLCTTAVKKAVNDLEGIEKVSARLNTKEVTVTYSEKVTLNQILEAIKTTSYTGIEISTIKE